jgi:hypothetical protein
MRRISRRHEKLGALKKAKSGCSLDISAAFVKKIRHRTSPKKGWYSEESFDFGEKVSGQVNMGEILLRTKSLDREKENRY